jgi:hypothetical protein
VERDRFTGQLRQRQVPEIPGDVAQVVAQGRRLGHTKKTREQRMELQRCRAFPPRTRSRQTSAAPDEAAGFWERAASPNASIKYSWAAAGLMARVKISVT